jgi:hypothetical protein
MMQRLLVGSVMHVSAWFPNICQFSSMCYLSAFMVSLLTLVACVSLVSSLTSVAFVASSTSNLCLMWGNATHFTRIRKGAKLTHAIQFSK